MADEPKPSSRDHVGSGPSVPASSEKNGGEDAFDANAYMAWQADFAERHEKGDVTEAEIQYAELMNQYINYAQMDPVARAAAEHEMSERMRLQYIYMQEQAQAALLSSTSSTAKKTKFQIALEEKEKKRKKDEEDLQAVYSEFVDDFASNPRNRRNNPSKAFVKGETIVPLDPAAVVSDKTKKLAGGFVLAAPAAAPSAPSAPAAAPAPATAPAAAAVAPKKPVITFTPLNKSSLAVKSASTSSSSSSSGPASVFRKDTEIAPSKKPAAGLAGLLGDLKRQQAEREQRKKEKESGPSSSSSSAPAHSFSSVFSAADEPDIDEKPKKIISISENHTEEVSAAVERAIASGLLPASAASILSSNHQSTPIQIAEHPDDYSTNLFVRNLSPHVTEDLLLTEFGRFGPIGSIKIMWPRKEEERMRGRNSGFVCFMHRKDAENARSALDYSVLFDQEIRVSWGKPIALPSQPITSASMSASSSSTSSSAFASFSSPEEIPIDSDGSADPNALSRQQITVQIPEDPETRRLIDRTARFVVEEGYKFEVVLMEREKENPNFSFLAANGNLCTPSFSMPYSAEHAYYRWRVFSLIQGDSMDRWRTLPFLMFIGGPTWIPPASGAAAAPSSASSASISSASVSDSDRKRKKDVDEKKGELSDRQRDDLFEMLRSLTNSRPLIKNLMAFAMDHADASPEIVETLVESLTLSETAHNTKLARLFAVSDILYNSSAPIPNASSYRKLLSPKLPTIFKSLLEAYKASSSRISGEAFKEQVLRVLRAWEHWSLFPAEFVRELLDVFAMA